MRPIKLYHYKLRWSTFKVVLGSINGFIDYLENTAYVIYNGQTSCKQLFLLSYSMGRTVYDAERNLLAIAKFLTNMWHFASHEQVTC